MDVADEVKRIIAKALKVPVDQLDSDTQLTDLGAQSLDIVEIIFELEEKFDISIPVAEGGPEALEYDTVRAVSQAVKRLVDAKHP
jgi:acyl carrier protein